MTANQNLQVIDNLYKAFSTGRYAYCFGINGF